MDIKKYISSGILEQYVLGLATEAERQEVEKYAQMYPQIKKELEAIEVAMEQYAILHELPKPDVKAKFNQRIDELSKHQNPPSSPKNNSSWGGIWLSLLFVGALLASGWWGFSNYKKYQNTDAQLSAVSQELDILKNNCEETQSENETLKNRIKILQDPDNQTIKVVKADEPQIFASIIWNPQTKKSYLFNTNKLAPPPPGKQYQLWAIVDGKPVDMKPFDIATDGEILQEVQFVEKPSAFAISLEDAGGSPAPTLVIAAGNV